MPRGRPRGESDIGHNGLTCPQWNALKQLGRASHLPAIYFLREAVDEYLAQLAANAEPGDFDKLLISNPQEKEI